MELDGIDFSWESIESRFPAGETTAAMVDAFLRDPEVERMVQQITRRAINRNAAQHLGPEFKAEMAQECRTYLYLILTDPATRASAQRIQQGLAAAMSFKFPDRVRTLLDSAEYTGTRGASTRQRRRRALATHRERMIQESGQVPSDSELLESYNAKVSASRADASRQGVLASDQDLVPTTPVELDPSLAVTVASTDSDDPLPGLYVAEMVQQVIRACTAEGDEVLVRVARAWLLAVEPGDATTQEICEQTGLPIKVVRAAKVHVKDVFRDVLETHYGITLDAPAD